MAERDGGLDGRDLEVGDPDPTLDQTLDRAALDPTTELVLRGEGPTGDDASMARFEAAIDTYELTRVPTLRADLLTPVVTVLPGEPVTVSVQVLNTTPVIETVTVRMLGLIPETLTCEPAAVTLFPDEAQQIDVVLRFHPTLPAQIHEAVLVVAGSSLGNVPAELPLTVEVPRAPSIAITAEPDLRIAGKKTTFDTLVENTGNTPLAIQVRATDADRHLTLYFNRPSIRLGVDQYVSATLLASGKRPWTGAPVERVITITAEHDEQVETHEVRFRQKAILTAGVITILTLLLILALWAGAMFFGVQAALGGASERKVMAATFTEGTGLASLDPAVIGGSITGDITAASTAEPLPRVSVEAFDMQGELVGATATGDDGSYELGGLLPAQHRLRIRAEGFQTVWWPDGSDPEAAEQRVVEPNEPTTGTDAQLVGFPGQLGGRAVLGDDESAAVSVELEATDLLDEAPIITAEVGEDGLWAASGLTTPATYRVTFRAEGYAPTEILQSLAGGEQLVINPTRLSAAPGSISGTVVDRSGDLLGGVAVTARKGDLEVTTVTPTSGEVGVFTLTDLETPGTYLVTFALDGFAEETVAIRLEPGGNEAGRTVELAPATGEVTGNVFDLSNNDLGGVSVTVSGGGVEFTTDTFTSGDPGSYRISGLPLPGTYTVTFELEGYGQETQQITLDRDAPAASASVALRPSVGRIAGRVVAPGGQPLGAVAVQVSDGDVVRETTTASAPAAQAGRFSFANLPPGTYTITATRPDGGSETRLQTVEAAGTAEIQLEVAGG